MGEAKRRKERDPNYGQPQKVLLDIRPDKSSDAFFNLPPGTSSDDYLNYLDQNWDIMATFAYDSYLREGRGVLILDWDLSLDAHLNLLSPTFRELNKFDNQVVNRQINCPMFYIGDRNPLKQAFGQDWFSPDMQRVIQRYDPELSIVLFLCWGFKPNSKGNIMGRVLALPQCKTPKQLYIDNAGRQQEVSFVLGTAESPPAPPDSRIIRAFFAEVQSNSQFQQSLRTAFDTGFKRHGKGAVIAIPDRNQESLKIIYCPAAELAQALGADSSSRAFEQAWTIVEMCNPATQVASIVVSEDVNTKESFTYHSALLNIQGGDRA